MQIENFNKYQVLALKTAIYPKDQKINYPILGLVGEAGEVANKYKKVLRDNNGILTDEVRKELLKEVGDILWYMAALVEDLDSNLAEVATLNIEKLEKRQLNNTIKGSGDNR